MQYFEALHRINWHAWLLAAGIVCFSTLTTAAETTGTGNTSPAITQDTADAILRELKEIRRVLEKIEKQGGSTAFPGSGGGACARALRMGRDGV